MILARSIMRLRPYALPRARILAFNQVSHLYFSSATPLPESRVKSRVRSTLGPDSLNPTNVSQPCFSKSGQLLRVNISEDAVRKLRQLKETEKSPNLALRIRVESGGCHGFQYIFKLEDDSKFNSKDSVFDRDGCKVIIDHISLRILRDSTIDYTTELIGSQFKVKSPHTSSSCGCGTSFSLDIDE